MRNLNRIIFINSANIPYADDIYLDGNVHFIGTQGVGKSTVLRAILFFYNADTQKLGIPVEKQSYTEYYFPYSNSYIIYEVTTEQGAFCILSFKSMGRVCYRFIDSPYRMEFFVDENRTAYSGNDRIRAALDQYGVDYSRIIYPLFLWYAYSAQQESEHIFTLADFRASVRLNFLEIEHNGLRTLAWLRRNVARRDQALRERHAEMIEPKRAFAEKLFRRGVTPENTYLFMHGHTLMDNVVIVLLNTVCEKLRELSIAKITASSKKGVALKNEMSNYTNSLRSIRDVLLDNENYTDCFLFRRLQCDIERYLLSVLGEKRMREVFGDAMIVRP